MAAVNASGETEVAVNVFVVQLPLAFVNVNELVVIALPLEAKVKVSAVTLPLNLPPLPAPLVGVETSVLWFEPMPETMLPSESVTATLAWNVALSLAFDFVQVK